LERERPNNYRAQCAGGEVGLESSKLYLSGRTSGKGSSHGTFRDPRHCGKTMARKMEGDDIAHCVETMSTSMTGTATCGRSVDTLV